MAHLLLLSRRRLWCLFRMAVVGAIIVLLFSRFLIRRRTHSQTQRDVVYSIEILRDALYRAELEQHQS